jgi:CcmD family protein
MAVNLVIWFGIAFYLFSLDRKIAKLEKEKNEGE